MDNIIEIKNLTKEYPGFKLDNISFNIPKGSIMGLIGENGAGKTTTIKLILNIISKDKGKIKIFDKDNILKEIEVKEDIGVVLDDSFLSLYLSVTDINKIMKNFYNNWDSDLYFSYLKQFDLENKKIIKDFSSGMKMKLKIAIALAHHPKLLILDEPTSGLDPIFRNELLNIFRDFVSDDEHSILFSTHITSDLEHVADYITFIHQGKIIFSLDKDVLTDEFGLVKCNSKDFSRFDKEDYIKYQELNYHYRVLVKDRKRFKAKYDIKTIDKPSLEDIMLTFIKGDRK